MMTEEDYMDDETKLFIEVHALRARLAHLLSKSDCEGSFCGVCYRQGLEDAACVADQKMAQWDTNENLRIAAVPHAALVIAQEIRRLIK